MKISDIRFLRWLFGYWVIVRCGDDGYKITNARSMFRRISANQLSTMVENRRHWRWTFAKAGQPFPEYWYVSQLVRGSLFRQHGSAERMIERRITDIVQW